MWCHLKATKMRSKLQFLMFTGHNNHNFYRPQLVKCVQLAWIPDENNNPELFRCDGSALPSWYLDFRDARTATEVRFEGCALFSALCSHRRVLYWCLHMPPLRSLFHLVGVCVYVCVAQRESFEDALELRVYSSRPCLSLARLSVITNVWSWMSVCLACARVSADEERWSVSKSVQDCVWVGVCWALFKRTHTHKHYAMTRMLHALCTTPGSSKFIILPKRTIKISSVQRSL